MGVGLCKEKSHEPSSRKHKQRNSKTRVSGISNLPMGNSAGMERSNRSKVSTITRKSDLSMYYSCVPNENTMAMNNAWLAEAEYEEPNERSRVPSEFMKDSRRSTEARNNEGTRKKGVNNEEIDHNETTPNRDQLAMSEKLKSITDRADSEESPTTDKYENESEGFYEPDSYEDIDMKPRESVTNRKDLMRFSFADLRNSMTSAGLETEKLEKPENPEHTRCIRSIQETFGFLKFVFGEKLDGYQKVYEDKEGNNGLQVQLKVAKGLKGQKVACVQSEWYVSGKGEVLVEYMNTAKGMNDIMQHIGSFEEYETLTDDKNQKYVIYGMSYELGLNTHIKGPVFARAYKSVKQGEWYDAFKALDVPNSNAQEGGSKISVGGHWISKVAGQENKYKVRLYFETVLPGEESDSESVSMLGERVRVYVNNCVACVNQKE